MMTNLEKSLSYAQGNGKKIFAMVAKDGRNSVFCIFDYSAMRAMLENVNTRNIERRDDGNRWKGLRIDNLDHYEIARIRIPIAWNGFKADKRGFMATSQELAMIDALNNGAHMELMRTATEEQRAIARQIASMVWTHTGNNHRRGIADAVAMDADGNTWQLEVKGIDGRLFYS